MDQLAELRERRALTLRELAEMSGVAADTINQIELGHRKPRPSTLRKLARALEVNVEELMPPKARAPSTPGQPEDVNIINLESRDDIPNWISEILWNLPEAVNRRLVVNIYTDDSAEIHSMPSGSPPERSARKKRAEK
jgi:transcriptional regulator with XRE-family HTH domain